MFETLVFIVCAIGFALMLINCATLTFNEIIKRLPQWKKNLQEVNNNGK